VKRFVDGALKPVLIVGGLGTAAAGLYAFWPQWAVKNIANIEFTQDYTIFVQHWGIMVGLIVLYCLLYFWSLRKESTP